MRDNKKPIKQSRSLVSSTPRLLKKGKGFTLLELLLAMGLIAIVVIPLTGILYRTVSIGNREGSASDVSETSRFVFQQIQNNVKNASLIDMGANATSSTLLLRMRDTSTTTIYASGTTIYLTAGGTDTALTDSKVTVNSLVFTKFSNPPAKDSIQIDMTLSAVSTNSGAAFSKPFRLAIERVSAAVFDASLLPGSDNAYDIGLTSPQRWRNASFSGGVNIGGSVGIGTTTPSSLLHVWGDIRMGSSSASIIFADASRQTTAFSSPVTASIGGTGTTTNPTTGALLVGSIGNLANTYQLVATGTLGYILTTTSTVPYVSWEKSDEKNTYFMIENPAVGEDDVIMTFDKASTLKKIYAVNKSSGDTFTWNLCSAASRVQATSTCDRLAFSSYNVTTGNTTPTSYTSFGTSSISAGDVMRLVGTSASTSQFNITIYYSTP
ncbi:MAG: prepilin-type N-terminal cleavage/methylation domain-containing protein [bacterium]|nr:prepilin-type N-terminal cleavage/methylation domain-containing protein [bacterium]